MYLLKFVKVPKTVKKMNIIPLKKWIYLPQAQDFYLQIIEKESFEGEITLLVQNRENLQEVQFNVSYEEGYNLSDLITQDLIEEIRRTTDDNTRTSLEIMENEIVLSFAEPISIDSNVSDDAKKTLLATIESKLPFKFKKADSDNFSEEEASEISEDVNYQEGIGYTPDYEEGEESEKELLLKPVIEIEPEIHDKEVPTALTVEPGNSDNQIIKFPTLQEYIAIESMPILQDLDRLIIQVEERTENGLSHVLRELNLSDPKSFIDQRKRDFVEKSFNKEFYSSLISNLMEAKSNLLNKAILALTEQYEKQLNELDPSLLKANFKSIQADIESKWQEELTQRLQALSKRHKQTIEQIETRQKEEITQLHLKHSQEMTNFKNNYLSEKERTEKDIQESIHRESKSSIETFKEESLRKKEVEGIQALETFKVTQFESMRQIVTESLTNTTKTERKYLAALTQRLEDEKPGFEIQFRRYLEDQDREEAKRKEQEELRLKAREIAVNEKKVELEEKTIKESIDTTKRMEKQNHELLLSQQTQLLESIKAMQVTQQPQIPQVTEPVNQPVPQPTQSSWWKGFLVATITFVTIGGIGTILYTVHNIYSTQEKTTQLMEEQTNEMEQRLMGVIESQENQTTQSSEEESLESFEEYLIEERYLEAAEDYPNQKEDIVEYLLAQGDIDSLKQFSESYPINSDLQLLKAAILIGDNEDIFDLYLKNDWDTIKNLSAIQKEKLALVLYQKNYAVEANLLLED